MERLAVLLFVAGVVICGADTIDAWWPWFNLAGVPVMAAGVFVGRRCERY